jgi:hypothetical protein
MKKNILILFGLFIVYTCTYAQDNELTSQEIADGWQLLFNGENLYGWTSVGKNEPPTVGWEIKDGVLTVRRIGDKRGGDIITKDQYSDFDLKVDFKITEGANSGIKYLFKRYEKGGWLGLEFQILDDERHPDAKLGRDGNRHQAGLYDMFPPSENKIDSPIGEWNQARIIVKGSKVTHYLNGQEVLTFDRFNKAYLEAYLLSKYNESDPVFGLVDNGYILLQDHGDVVSFKNIKIKVLN